MKIIYIFWVGISVLTYSSCSKYLETKPDDSLATPTTLSDLQLLLDDYNAMNEKYVSYAEVLSDNYYITPDSWNSLSQGYERDYYVWKQNADAVEFWSAAYRVIFQCNVVLDGVQGLKDVSDLETKNRIIGSALFFRGYYLLGLTELYTLPYKKENAEEQIGLPIKLSPIVTEVSFRSSLADTYKRILEDLKESAAKLPKNSLPKSRPTKSSAYGALAKCYLIMNDYDSSKKYSDLCISLSNGRLLDYNTDINLQSNKPLPFWMDNPETIIPIMNYSGAEILLGFNAKIDTSLYQSYSEFDLRKQAYFRLNSDGSYRFKGNIFGNSGSSLNENRSISLPEMYFIRAESLARMGNIERSLEDLNTILKNRFHRDHFVPATASTSKEALDIILAERRKELVFTGTRWTDLRRFRSDSYYSVTPVRKLNDALFKLLPNSTRYALKIPQSVIELSGMNQNE